MKKLCIIYCLLFSIFWKLPESFSQQDTSTIISITLPKDKEKKESEKPEEGKASVFSEDTIPIGVPLASSGRLKDVSQHVRRGYELSLEQINNRGGVRVGSRFLKLELVYADTGSNPVTAISATEALIKKNIRFLLGPYGSEIAEVIYPLAEKYKIPFVQTQGAALSLYNPNLRYTFSTPSSADQYLKPAVKLIGEASLSFGRKSQDLKVSILVRDDPGSQDIRSGVIEEIKAWNMQIVSDKTITSNSMDLSAALEEIAKLLPDLLVVSLQADGARPFVNELTKRKIDLPMIAMTHCDAARLEDLKPKSDYILCSSQWDPFLNYPDRYFGSSVDYTISYNLKYNENPPYQAAGASAGVVVFADAFERAESLDSEKVRDALGTAQLKTLYGEIRFDSEKNKAKPMVIYQLLNGVYRIVYPLTVAWSKLIYPMPPWEERVVD